MTIGEALSQERKIACGANNTDIHEPAADGGNAAVTVTEDFETDGGSKGWNERDVTLLCRPF